ncbi:MAG TPA: SCP2 sterol-binding domain-containing protein [Candidatus Limnocylindrales bacterium]|nr:SCP2 sterol-binding domain-containing protein [Candidatus Limnocylindrales bacterium]
MAEQATSAKQVFEVMPSRFNAAAAQGVNATYQFDLTGDGGGTWQVKVANGTCEVSEGAPGPANITITMAASDYLDMINGKLNPQMAFMGGKLKIKGDMSLALKMQQIFPNA